MQAVVRVSLGGFNELGGLQILMIGLASQRGATDEEANGFRIITHIL
jgi:hypothetical protein